MGHDQGVELTNSEWRGNRDDAERLEERLVQPVRRRVAIPRGRK